MAMVFTLGHSNHPYAKFLELLRSSGADAVVDVRSTPYSRRMPHFNTRTLQAQLQRDDVAYHYLGAQLGGRPADPTLYRDGRADYERMATAAEFLRALDAVERLALHHRPALMCAERDPLDCHRCLLVARTLAQRGVAMAHILADGSVMPQQAIEDRLLETVGVVTEDLFATRTDWLAAAYRKRAGRAAFAEPRSAQ